MSHRISSKQIIKKQSYMLHCLIHREIYNNSNPSNNSIILQYPKMALTNQKQPRLPTTPFEIHVPETHMGKPFVSGSANIPFVDMCSISIRDFATFSLTK